MARKTANCAGTINMSMKGRIVSVEGSKVVSRTQDRRPTEPLFNTMKSPPARFIAVTPFVSEKMLRRYSKPL
jgi:hypothetical protein